MKTDAVVFLFVVHSMLFGISGLIVVMYGLTDAMKWVLIIGNGIIFITAPYVIGSIQNKCNCQS